MSAAPATRATDRIISDLLLPVTLDVTPSRMDKIGLGFAAAIFVDTYSSAPSSYRP